jgi:hypothetical protein
MVCCGHLAVDEHESDYLECVYSGHLAVKGGILIMGRHVKILLEGSSFVAEITCNSFIVHRWVHFAGRHYQSISMALDV